MTIHNAADGCRFEGGQLYANLRGFGPSRAPAGPADIVREFLHALGVPPERIPPGPDAQAALYRGVAADKRILIVLDNARDEKQVRPLVASSPGSLVLITSRNQLAGLAVADGARLLGLDVLNRAAAVQLLTARLDSTRVAAEPGAVAEIAHRCAGLPLALAVAAARAAARPHFPLAALAAELSGQAGRLDALDSGEEAGCVRTVFSWSFRQLSPAATRMFLLVGIHPGPDISAPAAASLAGCPLPQARRLLAELARVCLVTELAPAWSPSSRLAGTPAMPCSSPTRPARPDCRETTKLFRYAQEIRKVQQCRTRTVGGKFCFRAASGLISAGQLKAGSCFDDHMVQRSYGHWLRTAGI